MRCLCLQDALVPRRGSRRVAYVCESPWWYGAVLDALPMFVKRLGATEGF